MSSVNSCKTYIYVDVTLLSERHLKPHKRLYEAVYIAKRRIFNNVLHVRHAHLTTSQAFS
jgi:hypothetical protein